MEASLFVSDRVADTVFQKKAAVSERIFIDNESKSKKRVKLRGIYLLAGRKDHLRLIPSGSLLLVAARTKVIMVKIDYFDVQFDAKNAVYYAGQKICGVIVISLQDSLKASSLWVSLMGEAKTSWVNKTSDKIFERLEAYVNERQDIPYLHRISDGELMPAGVHSIPFAFQLPPQLPSSYEGDFGYVRYYVTAHLELSSNQICALPGFQGGRDMKLDKTLTVLAVVDAGAFPSGAGYAREETFEIVGCCRSSGSLTASISVPGSAFVIGQPLHVTVRTVNNTSKKSKPASLLLIQEAHFESRSRYENVSDAKTLTRVVDSATFDVAGEPNGDKSLVKEILFELPADLTPSTVNLHCIISVGYKLKLDLGVGCEIVQPIYIASVNSKAM